MKIRTGFVSNSSSCSFSVRKDLITEVQAKALLNFCDFMAHHPDFQLDPAFDCWANEYDNWTVHESPEYICMFTVMDNIDMLYFCYKLGIPLKAITDWWHSNDFSVETAWEYFKGSNDRKIVERKECGVESE